MNEKEFDYMNVIPLVDVMLVLLTIVLTTSTFIATGQIPVDLPSTENSSASKSNMTESKTIELNKKGDIYYSAKRLSSIEELKSHIAGLAKNTEILIRADRNLALQNFVEVLELVKSQGLDRVSLQTEESL